MVCAPANVGDLLFPLLEPAMYPIEAYCNMALELPYNNNIVS
jgi:hypothetical protein